MQDRNIQGTAAPLGSPELLTGISGGIERSLPAQQYTNFSRSNHSSDRAFEDPEVTLPLLFQGEITVGSK